jgi:hypothetical protein
MWGIKAIQEGMKVMQEDIGVIQEEINEAKDRVGRMEDTHDGVKGVGMLQVGPDDVLDGNTKYSYCRLLSLSLMNTS